MTLRLWKFCSICYYFFTLTNAEPLSGTVSPVNPLEFPFIASIGIKDPSPGAVRGHIGTGSLISRKHVLTAAHCLVKLSPIQIDVIIGEVDLKTAHMTKYDVYSWITYADWALKHGKPSEFKIDDVAIIKLATSVYREGIVPVRLSRLDVKQVLGTEAVIAGWGITDNNTFSIELLKAKVRILSKDECKHQVKLITNLKRMTYPKSYLFTKGSEPYVIVGQGDGGGPLLDKNNFLLGVSAGTCPNFQWGDFSAEFLKQYEVNIYLSVNYYKVFIDNVLGKTNNVV